MLVRFKNKVKIISRHCHKQHLRNFINLRSSIKIMNSDIIHELQIHIFKVTNTVSRHFTVFCAPSSYSQQQKSQCRDAAYNRFRRSTHITVHSLSLEMGWVHLWNNVNLNSDRKIHTEGHFSQAFWSWHFISWIFIRKYVSLHTGKIYCLKYMQWIFLSEICKPLSSQE